MTTLYSKLDNFFNCCNIPLSIIDSKANFLYERNLNDYSKKAFVNLDIFNNIFKDEISIPTEFVYNDLKVIALPFSRSNNASHYLILGPYSTNLSCNSNIYLINCEKGLTYFIKLLKLFLSYKNICPFQKDIEVSPIVKESLDYVHKNYNKQITIDDICEKFKINKCYFCCMFKKETGHTFINYLNNHKIEKSKELLKNTNMTLLDISLEVGFNNQSYYSTIFKKYTNMTPLEYRETALYS